MSSLLTYIVAQGSHVKTITCETSLHAKPRIHDSCQPVRPIPYHYVSPAFRKKYDNYNSIHHPELQQVSRYSTCGEAPKICVKQTPVHQTKTLKSNKICRPYKTLTEKQIRLRIERQTLRDMRNRIRSPPRATKDNLKFKKLVKMHTDLLEDPTTLNKTTQLNCPPLEFEQPEKPKRIGFDRSTQVTSAELGNWDDVIANFVEVITGKITQQCMMELCHEEELHELRVHYRRLEEFGEIRKDDERDIKEAENERQRIFSGLLKDQNERKQNQEDLMNRIGAAMAGDAFIRDLLPPVLDQLHQYGVHLDEVVEEINEAFTDALTEQVTYKCIYLESLVL